MEHLDSEAAYYAWLATVACENCGTRLGPHGSWLSPRIRGKVRHVCSGTCMEELRAKLGEQAQEQKA